MATRTSTSAAASTTQLFPFFQKESRGESRKWEAPQLSINNRQMFAWEQLASDHPLVHLLQPDYYMVFRFSAPGMPVYQQNLHLDNADMRYEVILGHMDPSDLKHLQRIDCVMNQFARECRLLPFDFICSSITRWTSPDAGQRYFMRKMTVLQCDAKGIPSYGMITFKDVTPMVSAIKPNNVDVTFNPDKASLCYELSKRINAIQPKRTGITTREKDIVRCLSKGMSSKEIASVLYISKSTVDTHRQNLIHKWEVTNTAALLQRAMEEGCI